MARYTLTFLLTLCLFIALGYGAIQLNQWKPSKKPPTPHPVAVNLAMFQIAPTPITKPASTPRPTKPNVKHPKPHKKPTKKTIQPKKHPTKIKPKIKPKLKPKIKPKQKPKAKPKPKPKPKPAPQKEMTSTPKTNNQPTPTAEQPTQDTPPSKTPPTPEKPKFTQQQITQAEKNYLNELSNTLAQHAEDTYPRRAKRRHWQGTVQIEFTLKANGDIINTHILQTSNREILDEAALDIIRQEMQNHFKPFPKELTKTTWTLDVPIQYHLR